jgi:hypothetical protein
MLHSPISVTIADFVGKSRFEFSRSFELLSCREFPILCEDYVACYDFSSQTSMINDMPYFLQSQQSEMLALAIALNDVQKRAFLYSFM